MICREMLSPIPLPFSLVVKKGINICSAMFGGYGRTIVGYFNQYSFSFIAIGAYMDVHFPLLERRTSQSLHGILQQVDDDL